MSNLNAEDLDLSGRVEESHINRYDHPTLRLQELQIMLGKERIGLLAEDGYLNHC